MKCRPPLTESLHRGLIGMLAAAACAACFWLQPALAVSLITPGAVVDLSAEGTIPNVYLGSAVAVEKDTAIVAGLKPGGFGMVIAYARNGASWNTVRHLEELPGVDTHGFGYALALSGDTLAVLTRPSTTLTTAVTIFVRTAGVWSVQKTFTQNDWPIANVASIALSGDTLCFGNPTDAPAKLAIGSGLVDVFRRTGSTWSYQKTLSPSDPQRGQRFGAAIALDNDRLAVGAPITTTNKITYSGACYVFTRTGDVWRQTARITEPDAGLRYQLGSSVALSGNCLLAGSPARGQLVGSPTRPYAILKGTVATFHLNAAGIWQSEGLLPAPVADPDPSVIAAPQALGVKIAFSGSLAVVGNPTLVVGTDRSYVYQRRGNHWVQLAPLVDNGFDPTTYDPLGYDPLSPPLFNLTSSPGGTVAVSGRTILVGAPNENTLAGVRSGKARFYNYVGGSLAAFDGATLDGPELVPDTLNAPVDVQIGDWVFYRMKTRSFTFQNTGPTTLTNLSFITDNPDVVLAPVAVTSLAPQASVTLTLTLTPTTYGDWEANVVAKAGTGSDATSLVLSLHSMVGDGPSPPSILADPVSAVLREQGSYDLTVDVTGTEPLTYKWFHNHKPLPGATKKVLSLTPVELADAGTYELQVNNEAGGTFSGPAEISVYQMPVTTALKYNEGAKFELKAPVSGTGIIVGWFLNGIPISDNAQFSGATTSKLVIKRADASTAGRYTLVVNPGELDVTAQTWNVTVSLLPVIQSNVTSLSSLPVDSGVTFHFVASPVAASFSFKGLPPGLVGNAKTGTLTGRPTQPGAYTLRVAGINAVGTGPERTIPLTVPALDSRAVGTLQAIIGRDPGNQNLGGKVTLSIALNGQCTGSAAAGARAVRFTAAAGLKPDSSPYRIEFDAVSAGVTDHYILDLVPATGSVTGQCISSLSPGTAAPITGWLNSWSATRPATDWSDYVTVGLNPPAGLDPAQHTIPYGSSYGTVSISPVGVAVWSGRMADGAATTGTSLISPVQSPVGQPQRVEIPLNFLLDAGKGSAQGTLLVFPNGNGLQADAQRIVGGTLDWLKLPVAGRSYAAGIPLHTLTASGGHYAPPPAETVVMSLPVAMSNARFVYTGAGIEQAWQYLLLPIPFTITTKGLTYFDPINPVPNTLVLNMKLGTFTGSMTIVDPNPVNESVNIRRTVSTSGVMLQNQGVGFFNLPLLPDAQSSATTSPIESGRVVIEEAD